MWRLLREASRDDSARRCLALLDRFFPAPELHARFPLIVRIIADTGLKTYAHESMVIFIFDPIYDLHADEHMRRGAEAVDAFLNGKPVSRQVTFPHVRGYLWSGTGSNCRPSAFQVNLRFFSASSFSVGPSLMPSLGT